MVKKALVAVISGLACLLLSFSSMAAQRLNDQAQCSDVKEIVTTIRGMYHQTNTGTYVTKQNQLIRSHDGWTNVIRTVASTGDPLLDPIMKKYGYQSYSLEYYYDNMDYGQKQISGLNGPNFIYAVIDGKEYRYYFRENSMIRRIGPEGTISDNPKTNEFLNLLYQAGCYYQNELSRYSTALDLQLETIAFSNNYYNMQDFILVQACIMERYMKGKYAYGVFVIDANTKISDDIHREDTWRQGDNGYTWMKRHLSTDQLEGGYRPGLECFCVKATDGHVDYIEGIYATH